MSITETEPQESSAPAPPAPVAPVPVDVADTPVSTGDHKRLGRAWLAISFLFLLVGGATGGLLSAERASTGFDVLEASNFLQIFSLHGVSATYLFLIPAWIGLATYVVPLQVGARNLALPRLSSLALWTYLVAGGLLVASYVAGGGPGSSDLEANELWISAFGLVLLALVAGLVPVITTVAVGRAPGMTLRRTPAFAWSMLVAGVLWVITLPVLLGHLVLAWIDLTEGGAVFGGDLLVSVAWAFGPPMVYLLAVPAAGVISEALSAASKAPAGPWPVLVLGFGGLGVLGLGVYASPVAGADLSEEFLFQAMGIAIIAPVMILIAGWADIVRRQRGLQVTPAGLFALGAVGGLLVGAVTGMAVVTDRLDLAGTTWAGAQVHFIGLGAGTLAVIAGLLHWAPKLWGNQVPAPLGFGAFGLMIAGVNLMLIPDLFTGVDDMPLGEPFYGADDTWEALSQLGGIGSGLVLAGVLVVLAAVGATALRKPTSEANPWGAFTLEWATASPPPRHNFDEVPAVESAAPLFTDDGKEG